MTSGAILAGGHARRFNGRDKTQLQVDGTRMIDRQCGILRACVERIFLVGYRGDVVPSHTPLSRVDDRVPDCGPLGGLDAALAAAGSDAVLLVACDLPNLNADLLGWLVGRLAAADADAVVPRTERGYHPLCAVYAQSCVPSVRDNLQRGQLRMTGLLTTLRLRVVETAELSRFGDPERLFANVNSQADLDAVESLKNH
jgi:molybdopterin-guanine dinucleotide biosynthesis protein A